MRVCFTCGSGLGLAITRRLVALMGGKIAVQSEPGRGTRFHLELPLKPAVQPECPPSAAQLPSAAGLPLEILVAEDNAVNQAVIRGVDGLEATTRIRAEESRRALGRTPIVAFTAHAVGAQHEECLAAGMDGVITKPVDLTTLLTVVLNTVRNDPSFRQRPSHDAAYTS